MEVYTNGSKMQNEVGSACIENETFETITVRKLPIKLALEYLKQKKQEFYHLHRQSQCSNFSLKQKN